MIVPPESISIHSSAQLPYVHPRMFHETVHTYKRARPLENRVTAYALKRRLSPNGRYKRILAVSKKNKWDEGSRSDFFLKKRGK